MSEFPAAKICLSPDDITFAEPWQARAFAVAVALNRSGLFPWGDFSSVLSAELNADGDKRSYYECWQAALENLLQSLAIVDADDIQARAISLGFAAKARDHHNHHPDDRHGHGSGRPPAREWARPVTIA